MEKKPKEVERRLLVESAQTPWRIERPLSESRDHSKQEQSIEAC
jgi:hypothetical protein